MTTSEDKFIINLTADNHNVIGPTSDGEYFSSHDLQLIDDQFKYVTGVWRFDTLESSFFSGDLFVPTGTSIYIIMYLTLGKKLHMMTWSPDVDLSNVFAIFEDINYRHLYFNADNTSKLKLVRQNFRYPKSWPYFIKMLANIDAGLE